MASLACLAGTAYAGPTGLVTIPIADILRHRELALAYQVSGNEKNVDPKTSHSNGAELGLFDRLEIGYDNDFEGTSVANAKVLLYETPKTGDLAVSYGWMNWSGESYDQYLAVRKDFAQFRLHAGWFQDDRNRLMLGIDTPLNSNVTLMADFTRGPGSGTWVGVAGGVPGVDGLNWMVGFGLPIEKSDGLRHTAMVGYNVRF
ncbi:MAG: hypothetical protein KIT11_08525 [Fimbriimonadaceae bacterium]|nr:hypothetical protein [Fimbriimonadaceae bacterium]QYK56398.1 MAG: hypothetical protein KF733_02720 [Fimbriimonadaceae bacterium]